MAWLRCFMGIQSIPIAARASAVEKVSRSWLRTTLVWGVLPVMLIALRFLPCGSADIALPPPTQTTLRRWRLSTGVCPVTGITAPLLSRWRSAAECG